MTTTPQGPFILVSGANRGIGFALVKALLQRLPQAVVFAGAREPTSAHALNDFAEANAQVHVVKLVVDDEASNKQAIEYVKRITDRLDIVVANAGITSPPCVPIHAEPSISYTSNYAVNTLGPLYLYQASYPLLMESRIADPDLPVPKFFLTSSRVGSTGGVPVPFINGSYGASKAAANYLARSIHQQTDRFGAVVVPYHPGHTNTDMARKAAQKLGLDLDRLPGVLSPEQCAAEYVEVIVNSTRTEHGGKFLGHGFGAPISW